MLCLLEERCPKLKKIRFDYDKLRFSNIGGVTKFIQCCKSLRSIILIIKSPNMSDSEDDENDPPASHHQYEKLFESLALSNHLEKLELNPDWLDLIFLRPLFTFETFNKVLQNIEQQPFMGLRKLIAVMDPTTATILVPKLNPNSLTTLDLKSRSRFSSVNPLPPICTLVNLQDLSIDYDDDTNGGIVFPSSDMLPLRK